MRIYLYYLALAICLVFVIAGLGAIFKNGLEVELWRGAFGVGFGAWLAFECWKKIQTERSYYEEGY